MKQIDKNKARRILYNRICERYLSNTESEKDINKILVDTLISEEKRLAESRSAVNRNKDIKFWNKIRRKIDRITIDEKKDILRDVIIKYYEEIAGNFDKEVYNFTYNVANKFIPLIYSGKSLFNIINPFSKVKSPEDTIILTGNTEHMRKLDNKGTLVLVPTHSSNLDSMIIGLALAEEGLPPFLYGAGRNLYTNPILAFFMDKLGAYTVDREKTHHFYKDILKEYATISMELGYNNIFFPGGGRSRSNIVDNKLKLGLLSSAFNAYINNIKNNNPKPDIYIVPATLSYHLCLEAKTLIRHHIKKISESVIVDDEFSQPDKLTKFLITALNMNLNVYFNIAEPLDLFGNRVDMDGNSIDQNGNITDIKSKIIEETNNFTCGEDIYRGYIKNLGDSIIKSYYKSNTVLSNMVLAFAVYYLAHDSIRKIYDDPFNNDIYKELRIMERVIKGLYYTDILEAVKRIMTGIRDIAGRGEITLSEEVKNADAKEVIETGMNVFNSLKKDNILKKTQNTIEIINADLLYYYKNRLEGYNLHKLIIN